MTLRSYLVILKSSLWASHPVPFTFEGMSFHTVLLKDRVLLPKRTVLLYELKLGAGGKPSTWLPPGTTRKSSTMQFACEHDFCIVNAL